MLLYNRYDIDIAENHEAREFLTARRWNFMMIDYNKFESQKNFFFFLNKTGKH